MPYGAPLESSDFRESAFNSVAPLSERISTSFGATGLNAADTLTNRTGNQDIIGGELAKGGFNTGFKPPEMLQPEDALKEYNVKTNGPISKDSAVAISNAEIGKEKEAEVFRNATMVGKLGPQLIGGLADPKNVSGMLAPEWGLVEKLAVSLGGGFLARTAARAAMGGAEFTVANLPGIAAEAAHETGEGDAYGGKEFLHDLGMSFAMGTVIHPVTGAFGDAYHAAFDAPVPEREAALKQTLGAAANDEPVNIAAPDKQAFVANLRQLREQGTIMGSTQEQVKQYKDMRDEAVKEIAAQPQMETEKLKALNDEFEQHYASQSVFPEYQDTVRLKEEADIYDKAARAAATCLGAP